MIPGGLLASRAMGRVGPVPTVLIVDDEPAIRMMVRRMLARLPCVVVEAGDGDEALALVRREPPQLILLDEPFEGLAPVIVQDLLATCRRLAEAGQTIVVVEQNITAALTLADLLYGG